MNKSSEEALLAPAISALSELGLTARLEPDQDSDAVLIITHEGRTLRYQIEVKRSIRREVIGLMLAFSRTSGDRLLITDYVTPPMADELRRNGIQFADTAGNVFLKNHGLLVVSTGRRPVTHRAAIRPLRVFRPSGIKTIFALLSVPDLARAPQREIARAAGVALGSVAKIIDGLRELGFVAEVEGTRRLLRTERLVDQWAEAYVRLLHPTLTLGRFVEPARNWWKQADPTAYGAQWGGETAAAILQSGLIPEETIVYAEKLPSGMWAQHRLQADPDGRVVLRQRFWNFETPTVRADVVPPLLVYADLLAAGDARSLEAARQIRDEYLV
ncbi:MAG TPA: type IV toxin-antitoxin system AbiEi family antitoxin [Thermoanaerobaculia bacterium]|nr:type IV toxin-antitoxin system AbiEi family antitoxin [Thermoanaerobaculia bacterium]